jgi:hypothetical protein
MTWNFLKGFMCLFIISFGLLNAIADCQNALLSAVAPSDPSRRVEGQRGDLKPSLCNKETNRDAKKPKQRKNKSLAGSGRARVLPNMRPAI